MYGLASDRCLSVRFSLISGPPTSRGTPKSKQLILGLMRSWMLLPLRSQVGSSLCNFNAAPNTDCGTPTLSRKRQNPHMAVRFEVPHQSQRQPGTASEWDELLDNGVRRVQPVVPRWCKPAMDEWTALVDGFNTQILAEL